MEKATDQSLFTRSKSFKNDLLEYLKTNKISSVDELWAETKAYYQNKLIVMGGSYASFNDYITVKIVVDDNKYSFDVFLKSCRS